MKTRTAKVIQAPESPVPVEVLAESIVTISQGVTTLLSGPLKESALILLIQHAAPKVGKYPAKQVSQADVRAVLEGIKSLEREYLKPRKP